MSFNLNHYQLFLNGSALFHPISAAIDSDGVLAISGASGSGKSTMLADFSGMLTPAFYSTGKIALNGKNIREIPIQQRNIGILFQEDLLFPHLNVYQNLVFGLPSHLNRQQKREQIAYALEKADLGGFEKRDIATLSGGQRSRISLLRTLLAQPDLILLDEPFSKLDKSLREQFRHWVFSQLTEQKIPAVLVTHDSDDIPNNSQTIWLETISHA